MERGSVLPDRIETGRKPAWGCCIELFICAVKWPNGGCAVLILFPLPVQTYSQEDPKKKKKKNQNSFPLSKKQAFVLVFWGGWEEAVNWGRY